uniref:Uncharacterized protein n=1 Tax=Anguilla anguilla TaxID=7936 RepID=A0A0E9SFY3_ANGAN
MTRSRLLYETTGVTPDEWDFCEELAVIKVSELLGEGRAEGTLGRTHAHMKTGRTVLSPCWSVSEIGRPRKKKKIEGYF